MNFFNEHPDMRYLDAAYVRSSLHDHYELIHDNPWFGDLVTMLSPSGDAVHMCVYVADDYFFTKNGMNPLAPWVLMKIPDMLLYFPSEEGHRMVIFRRRDAPPNASPVSLDQSALSNRAASAPEEPARSH